LVNPKKRAKKYQENKEKNKKRAREYYYKNREDILKYKKQHYEQNKEDIIEYHREYNEKNREVINQKARVYKDKNREKVKRSNRQYDRKRRDLRKSIGEKYTSFDEKVTRMVFDNVCANCGSKENLQIDHHYPLSKGFALSITNAVLLCKDCNWAKFTKLPEEFYSKRKLTKINLLLKKAKDYK